MASGQIWQQRIHSFCRALLPITLLGFYYMIREGLSWSDFGKAVEVAQAENQPQVNADAM